MTRVAIRAAGALTVAVAGCSTVIGADFGDYEPLVDDDAAGGAAGTAGAAGGGAAHDSGADADASACATITTADCDGDPSNGCETDTSLDPDHCGGCNMPCGPTEVCEAGSCAPCSPLTIRCGSPPRCVDTSSDPEHCGGCDSPCAPPDSACQNSQCRRSCIGALQSCSVGPLTSCTRPQIDPAHCGGCDMACAATEVCVDGSCASFAIVASCGDCAGALPTCCTAGPTTYCVAGGTCP